MAFAKVSTGPDHFFNSGRRLLPIHCDLHSPAGDRGIPQNDWLHPQEVRNALVKQLAAAMPDTSEESDDEPDVDRAASLRGHATALYYRTAENFHTIAIQLVGQNSRLSM